MVEWRKQNVLLSCGVESRNAVAGFPNASNREAGQEPHNIFGAKRTKILM